MREYHLGKLDLDINATQEQIREAYRRLSKQYHPDLNSSESAHEKFIEISNAHTYLTSKISHDVYQSQDSVDEQSDYEIWREKALQKSFENSIQREIYLQGLIQKINKFYLSPIIALSILFNLLLGIDYFLPYVAKDQKLLGIEPVYVSEGKYRKIHIRGNYKYRYNDYIFDDYVLRTNGGKVDVVDEYDWAKVFVTRIFDETMHASIKSRGAIYNYKNLYNVFTYFGYIIPFLIAFSIAFWALNKPVHKLNVGIAVVMIELFQLVLFMVR